MIAVASPAAITQEIAFGRKPSLAPSVTAKRKKPCADM